MTAAQLTFDTSGAGIGQPVVAPTKGINFYEELPGNNEIEIFRVTSDANGDWFFSRKFYYVKSVMVQNHGATFATGVARDPPKIVVTQGNANAPAKITINHSGTDECFSIILIGDM
jgi:hypothetical protein